MENFQIQEHMADLGIASLRSSDGLIEVRVVSNSMSPMLLEGDILVISSPDMDRLRCGDLVVIKVKQDFFTHRLIKIDDQHCLTKGDRWHLPDPLIRTSDIIGIVQSRERRGRTIDFRLPRWRRLNAVMGYLGLAQVSWLRILSGKKPAHQATTDESQALPFNTWLTWPLRLFGRVLLVIWGYK